MEHYTLTLPQIARLIDYGFWRGKEYVHEEAIDRGDDCEDVWAETAKMVLSDIGAAPAPEPAPGTREVTEEYLCALVDALWQQAHTGREAAIEHGIAQARYDRSEALEYLAAFDAAFALRGEGGK